MSQVTAIKEQKLKYILNRWRCKALVRIRIFELYQQPLSIQISFLSRNFESVWELIVLYEGIDFN